MWCRSYERFSASTTRAHTPLEKHNGETSAVGSRVLGGGADARSLATHQFPPNCAHSMNSPFSTLCMNSSLVTK